MLELVVLIVPLSLDSFAVAAALGVAGVPRSAALRVSLVLAAFEAGMPVVGVLVGQGVGKVFDAVARDAAAGILIILGAYLLVAGDDAEERRARALTGAHGVALIGLGIAVSVDELVIGLGIGLLDLPLAPTLVLIAVQAFVAAQLGLRLGARLGERLRERTEQAAALALLLIGVALLALPRT